MMLLGIRRSSIDVVMNWMTPDIQQSRPLSVLVTPDASGVGVDLFELSHELAGERVGRRELASSVEAADEQFGAVSLCVPLRFSFASARRTCTNGRRGYIHVEWRTVPVSAGAVPAASGGVQSSVVHT